MIKIEFFTWQSIGEHADEPAWDFWWELGWSAAHGFKRVCSPGADMQLTGVSMQEWILRIKSWKVFRDQN